MFSAKPTILFNPDYTCYIYIYGVVSYMEGWITLFKNNIIVVLDYRICCGIPVFKTFWNGHDRRKQEQRQQLCVLLRTNTNIWYSLTGLHTNKNNTHVTFSPVFVQLRYVCACVIHIFRTICLVTFVVCPLLYYFYMYHVSWSKTHNLNMCYFNLSIKHF